MSDLTTDKIITNDYVKEVSQNYKYPKVYIVIITILMFDTDA